MSRRPRAALPRDIDALELLSREQQGIGRHFRDHELLVSRGGDAERRELVPRLRSSALALEGLGLQMAARRALRADITRPEHPDHDALGRGPAGGVMVPFSVRWRRGNSRSPATCAAA